MIKVMYYWTEDGDGELCALDKIITEKDTRCYHCDVPIPAHRSAVKLRAVGDPYVLHTECALKGCNIHPTERGMHKRLADYLKDERLMNDNDRPRFIRSVKYALEHIENEARCYCYQDDPDYLEVKKYLENIAKGCGGKQRMEE